MKEKETKDIIMEIIKLKSIIPQDLKTKKKIQRLQQFLYNR